MAYANREEGLLRANARLGRIAVAGAAAAVPIGWIALKVAGISSPIYVAAVVYAVSAGLALRLPKPELEPRPPTEPLRGGWSRGRLPTLAAPALGAIGLRAAGGILLFLLAFSLRTAEDPASRFAAAGAAGIAGGFVADLLAPTLPSRLREEALVIACLISAAVGAVLAWQLTGVVLLAFYALTAGAATEFARLALQALIQRDAPAGALGSVVVRYEVLYQVAWVGAAFIPTLIPIAFRTGIVLLALFYVALVAVYWWRWRLRVLDPSP
jgi:hypothetical protein